jgi:hypothetical protein
MAKILTFDADHHSYFLGDEELPSVSSILRFIAREVYENTHQFVLDRAADRGKRIHKACEILDKYGEADVEPDIEPYVMAYVQFLKDYKPDWKMIEKTVYHPERKYAGTIDRFGFINDKPALIDIKSVSTVSKPLVKAQLNGYSEALKAKEGIDAEILACLQLLDNGKYRFYEAAKDMTEFDACYDLHMAINKKHERGRIN